MVYIFKEMANNADVFIAVYRRLFVFFLFSFFSFIAAARLLLYVRAWVSERATDMEPVELILCFHFSPVVCDVYVEIKLWERL